MTATYFSPTWPCETCGGIERYSKGLACVACKQYRGVKRERYRSKNGPAYGTPDYRPIALREWPSDVDYGGENSFPDTAPYNASHRGGSYSCGVLMGSTAADAAIFGEGS